MKKQNHTTKTSQSNKSRQSGFSPLLLILIIVIVLALGFTGWFIWQRNQQGNNNNNQPNTTQDSQQPTNNNNQQPTDPIENGKYLVIEEWGVRFPLSKLTEESNISYEYLTDDNNANNSDISSVSFTLPSGSALEYCINIHIDREREEFRDVSTLSGFPVVAKYDGYLYYERRNHSYCAEEGSSTAQAADSLMDDIAEGIRALEKVKD